MNEQEEQLYALIELAQTQQTALTQAGADLKAAREAFTAAISERTTAAMVQAEDRLARTSSALSVRFFRIIAQVAGGTVVLVLAVAGMLWLYQSLLIDALEDQRKELQAVVDDLAKRGGKIKMATCGDRKRLCIRMDRSAPPYPDEYYVPKGY